jgi:hypothetical protein
MGLVLSSGSSQYLEMASAPVTDEPFSVSLWLKTTTVIVEGIAWSLADSTVSKDYWMLEHNSAAAAAGNRAGGGTVRSSASTISVNTWHHVVGVWSASNNRLVYLDDSAGSSSTNNHAVNVPDAMAIGRFCDSNPSNYFDGKIYQVGLWSAALNSTHVSSLFAGDAINTVDSGNLVSWWPLDTDANDDQSTNHFTEYNSPTYDADVPSVFASGASIPVLVNYRHRNKMRRAC